MIFAMRPSNCTGSELLDVLQNSFTRIRSVMYYLVTLIKIPVDLKYSIPTYKVRR